MKRSEQIYKNAILGGIGGLTAWFLLGMIGWSLPIHLENLLFGAGIGAIIGAFLGASEGIFINRKVKQALRGAQRGALWGAGSGAIGLLIGGLLFVIVGGGFVGRLIGWVLFGAGIGLGQGMLAKKLDRVSYSVLGGTAAGAIGGLIYEAFTQIFLANSASAQVVLGAVGLIIIGASLGYIIPLTVETILAAKKATIVFLNGDREGDHHVFIENVDLGYADGDNFVHIPDRKVEKRQATIALQNGEFWIENIGSAASFVVAGQSLQPGNKIKIQDNTLIQIASVNAKFKVAGA